MDTSTLATALAVLQAGSVRGAARLLGRPPSSVADAFERFESELALKLAKRQDGSLSLTLAGASLANSGPAFVDILGGMAGLSLDRTVSGEAALVWASRHAIPIASLERFSVVVQTGSIRKASQRLGIGQPNLSRQMAQVETAIGKTLLTRRVHGSEPTSEGLELNDIARTLTAKLASLISPAKKRFADEIRTVKFGTIIPIGHESRLASRLAGLVARWQDDDGKPNLFVSSNTAEDLVEGLRSGRFDVALTDIAIGDKRFESRLLFESDLVLIGAHDLFLPDTDLKSLLRQHPVAIPSLRSGLRQLTGMALEPYVGEHGQAARLVEVDALSIIINLVIEHDYLAVMPFDAVETIDRTIGMARLPDAPKAGFHLVWQKTIAARKIAEQIINSLHVT